MNEKQLRPIRFPGLHKPTRSVRVPLRNTPVRLATFRFLLSKTPLTLRA